MEWAIYWHGQAKRLPQTEAHFQPDATAADLKSRLAGRTLTFCITAGRTGSVYVEQVLSLLPEVRAEHEPEPAFQRYLRRVQQDPSHARRFMLKYKLPYIAQLDVRHYVETSHVFGKGFLEPTLRIGIVPNLILLRREPRKVALSYLERYTVPGRTKYGFEFLLQPDDPKVMPLPGWRRMNDYQLCFWYALEVERRQREYAELIRKLGGRVAETTALALNDGRRFLDFASSLGFLPESVDSDELLKRHAAVSRKEHNKNPASLTISGDLDAAEAEVWDRISDVEPLLRQQVAEIYAL